MHLPRRQILTYVIYIIPYCCYYSYCLFGHCFEILFVLFAFARDVLTKKVFLCYNIVFDLTQPTMTWENRFHVQHITYVVVIGNHSAAHITLQGLCKRKYRYYRRGSTSCGKNFRGFRTARIRKPHSGSGIKRPYILPSLLKYNPFWTKVQRNWFSICFR
jgi:hypothetical protein